MVDAYQSSLEGRNGFRRPTADHVIFSGKPPGPSHDFLVHTSTGQVGGAELSLLDALGQVPGRPHFLVPAEGPLTSLLSIRGFGYTLLKWPRGLAGLTQSNWYSLPMVVPGLLPYLYRLFRLTGQARKADGGCGIIWSSGFKSHCACLLLSPWLARSVVFDIRDFLRPLFFRNLLDLAARRFGCRIRVNSRSVGRDFGGAEVHYPMVKLSRPPMDKRVKGGKKIIAHLAYFAPYKGQDIFLKCARKLLDAGVDAEFWLIGDVIYPAEAYSRYRKALFASVARLGLERQVRFLGKIAGRDAVQDLLEQVDLLIHCTREPEPFGRAVQEALMCGCEVICHRGSGVCEVMEIQPDFPDWVEPIRAELGGEYIGIRLPAPMLKKIPVPARTNQ